MHEDLVADHETLLPPGRANILRVDRVGLPGKGTAGEIAKLVDAAEAGDLNRMWESIARLEPGYPQPEAWARTPTPPPSSA
jgi:hypothetical protein